MAWAQASIPTKAHNPESERRTPLKKSTDRAWDRLSRLSLWAGFILHPCCPMARSPRNAAGWPLAEASQNAKSPLIPQVLPWSLPRTICGSSYGGLGSTAKSVLAECPISAPPPSSDYAQETKACSTTTYSSPAIRLDLCLERYK